MADHPWRGTHRDELDVRHAESARVVALEAQLREALQQRDAAERIAVALWDRQCAAKAPCNQGDDHEALRAQVDEMRKRRGGGG